MIWRTPYQTIEHEATAVPVIRGETLVGDSFELTDTAIVLGGFDLRAQLELGIWLRLCVAELPNIPLYVVYFLDPADTKSHRQLTAITPPSRHRSTILSTVSSEWAALVHPDKHERSFGCLIKNGIANPFMVGTPTEDSWDRFLSLLGCQIES